VVAPASADFLAKIANGICDDLLTTTCIARACPLIVAPAMNVEMWDNAATQRNVATLRADGVVFLGPASGDQACGEVGMGRMQEPDELLQGVLSFFAPKRLAGRKVIVTAGPTFEAIDTVRGITNKSSGKMGYAVAEAAAAMGADVTLISGPTALAPPAQAHFVYVTTAAEMMTAVKAHVAGTDYFFRRRGRRRLHAGRPPMADNSKKSSEPMEIKLKPTEDILAYVAALPTRPSAWASPRERKPRRPTRRPSAPARNPL
jgi:phosphopantothenoylcysteine decarboxylase/phosphopantothenate--cysteine ligase